MSTNHNIPQGSKGKDTELRRVFLAFRERPLTMKEVDHSIGIMRESICWYCRALRLSGRLFPVRKRECSVTKHEAMTWTSDPALLRPDSQMKLF